MIDDVLLSFIFSFLLVLLLLQLIFDHNSSIIYYTMVTFSFSMMRMIFLIVLLSEQLHVVMGRTIYVDATSTNPSTTCTGVNTGTACPTIESGLLLARNNDTVLIEPG